MAEPLTNDKVIQADNLVMNKKHDLYVSKQEVISVEDLKSALEWIDQNYEELQKKWIKEENNADNRYFSKWVRKKAFPAIYGNEGKE